jgi:hypothetical protein
MSNGGSSRNVLRPNTRRARGLGKSQSDFYEENAVGRSRNDDVVKDNFGDDDEEELSTKAVNHVSYNGVFAKPQWFHGREDETLFTDR